MSLSFMVAHNGHVYEMFGNSKHYSVQPPLLYKPAEMTNKSLTAKYFIYDVVVWPLFYSFLALPLRFGKQYSPNLLQKLQSCLPYTLPLWFLQSVCKHLSRWNPGFTFLPINILSVSGSNHCATPCLMQVTVCAEFENRIRLSLCPLHCVQFNFQDALSCKSRQSCRFYKIGQFLPKPNNGLPNFTFLRQPQNPGVLLCRYL